MAKAYPSQTPQLRRMNPLWNPQSDRIVPSHASDTGTAPCPPGPRPYPFVLPPLPAHLRYKMECPSSSEPRRKK